MEKKCSKCRKMLPLTEYKGSERNEDGYYKTCNRCIEVTSCRRVANPEKERERKRRWRAANREKVRESDNRWRAANREKAREYTNRWRVANPEKYYELNITAQAKKITQAQDEVRSEFIAALKDTLPPEALDKLKSLNEVT